MRKVPSKRAAQCELARRDIADFASSVTQGFSLTPFHCNYYRVLDMFARGEIKRLIVTIPPQHGKSLGASVLLPSYILGLAPMRRVVVASYNLSLASKFSRHIQRVMDSVVYCRVFPDTRLKSSSRDKSYVRRGDEFDIIGTGGGFMAVGREGALTGNVVDVMIIDDLYKDALEANSPTVRDNAWDWYLSVVKTRLHNNSQEVIVMTRWSEDDIVGRLSKVEKICDIISVDKESFVDQDVWYRLNLEAIKESDPSAIDPRGRGEALWEDRHGIKLLREKRALDQATFNAMYQGAPSSREGLLYGESFRTYTSLPGEIVKKSNYTDTADTGEDYLCSICYELSKDGDIYITDLVYTQVGMEYTEEAVAAMLNRNATRVAYVESNNGGRGFARNVRRNCELTKIECFTQSANKESRILTNAPTVLRSVVLPADWRLRWADFYRHITSYKRLYRSNRFHDAADVMTGIVEIEMTVAAEKRVKMIRFAY